MSKRLGGIIGCKDKASSWHLNGFPYGSNIGSINSMISGRNPPIYCTLTTLIAMQGHRTKIKCHVEVLSLQPMEQYIITSTLFDDVLEHWPCFVFAFCLVSLHGDY